jgi:hypothetical protein
MGVKTPPFFVADKFSGFGSHGIQAMFGAFLFL